MNVLIVSQYEMFRLTLASAAHGLIIIVLCSLRDVILNLDSVFDKEKTSVNLPELTVCRKGKSYSVRRALWDLLICVFSAVLLLLVNYIYNDGKFRIYTAIFSATVFFTVNKLFSPVFSFLFVLIVKGIRLLCVTAMTPFRWILGHIVRLAGTVVRSIRNKFIDKAVIGYTASKIKDRDDICKNGLLITSYKE